MYNTQRFKILALHHDPLVRAGVVTSLRRHPGFDVFEDLLDAQRTDDPIDVVVVDYHQAMRLLETRLEHGPLSDTRILALTSNDREIDVRRALEAGIHGYVLLGSPVQELVDGVTALANGGRRLGLAVAQRMADSLARVSLTSREIEVLQLVVKGESNKLIARQLGIEVGTVKSHMSAVLAKLNASSRTQAAAIAMSRGLVEERNATSTEGWPPHTRQGEPLPREHPPKQPALVGCFWPSTPIHGRPVLTASNDSTGSESGLIHGLRGRLQPLVV